MTFSAFGWQLLLRLTHTCSIASYCTQESLSLVPHRPALTLPFSVYFLYICHPVVRRHMRDFTSSLNNLLFTHVCSLVENNTENITVTLQTLWPFLSRFLHVQPCHISRFIDLCNFAFLSQLYCTRKMIFFCGGCRNKGGLQSFKTTALKKVRTRPVVNLQI